MCLILCGAVMVFIIPQRYRLTFVCGEFHYVLVPEIFKYTMVFVKLEENHANSFIVVFTSDKRWACVNQSLNEVLIGRWAGLFHLWGQGLNPRRVITWRREWRVNDGMTFCSILCPQINTISWQLRLKRGQEPEQEKKNSGKLDTG